MLLVLKAVETIWKQRILVDWRDKKAGKRMEYEGKDFHVRRVRVVGGIYDDRFLVKPAKSATAMMPNVSMELSYEGANEMLLEEMRTSNYN